MSYSGKQGRIAIKLGTSGPEIKTHTGQDAEMYYIILPMSREQFNPIARIARDRLNSSMSGSNILGAFSDIFEAVRVRYAEGHAVFGVSAYRWGNSPVQEETLVGALNELDRILLSTYRAEPARS